MYNRYFGSLIFYMSAKVDREFEHIYITRVDMESKGVRLTDFSILELTFPEEDRQTYPCSIGFNVSKHLVRRSGLTGVRVNFAGYYYDMEGTRTYFTASGTIPEEGALGFVI